MKSGIWTLFGFGASQVIRLLGNLIMARLLVPDSFGVMALANVILFGLVMFSDLGLRQSIIQSQRGDDEEFLNTVWTIQILRGLLLWGASILAALGVFVLVAANVFDGKSAYSDPELPWVMVVMAFSAVIQGFESTKTSTASRHLKLARPTVLNLINQIISIAVMLVLGFLTKSVWALVASALISALVSVAFSHLAYPGIRNRLVWSPPVVREVLHFGKWVFLTSIVGFLASSGDRLILGGLLDSTQMGLYATAFLMMSVINDLFGRLSGGTVFPALSEAARTDPASLRRVYYRFRTLFDAGSLLLAGIMLVAGHLVIEVLYDARYQNAGLFLQLLSLSLLELRYGLLSNAYMALGKPKYMIPAILVRIAVLFGALPVVYNLWGTNAAVGLIGISTVLTIPVSFYLAARLELLDWKRELMFLPLLPAGLLLGWGIDLVGRWALPYIGLHR